MSRWLRRDTYCGAKLTTTKTLEMHNIIQYYAQVAGQGLGKLFENSSSNPAHILSNCPLYPDA